MTDTDLAYKDVRTGVTAETSSLNGNLWFRFAAGVGAFKVSRAVVEMKYTDDRFVEWTLHVPVESPALVPMMPLLESLGTTDAEVLNLPADQQMEVVMSASDAIGELA